MPTPPLDHSDAPGAVYLASREQEGDLAAELAPRGVLWSAERLIATRDPPAPAVWAQDVWLAPRLAPIESIGDAVRTLRGVQRNWSLWSIDHHRRCALIEAGLPPMRSRLLSFPTELPTAPLGAFTLLERNLLLYSATRTSPLPHGEMHFEEDHDNPPSRAYLKLWDLFTRTGHAPRPGERCLDLGAAPGGWTWVLGRLGASVLAIDRAPLADSVAEMPGVTWRTGDAFSVDPAREGPVDWLFSDVIAKPERSVELIHRWLDAGACKHLVCTLKFRGDEGKHVLPGLAAIPGAQLMHLFHNRNEVTFVRGAL